jgi:GWxTD domain-containing protein
MKTKDRMNKILFVLTIMIITATQLVAQKNALDDKSKYYNYGNQFFVDAVEVPYENTDSIKIVVMFKVSNSLLHFEKNKDLSQTKKLMFAVPEFEAKLKNSDGIIKKYIRKIDTVWVDDYAKTQDKEIYFTHCESGVLPKDEYRIKIVLGEDDNPNIREQTLKPIKGQAFYKDFALSEPICVKTSQDEFPSEVYPFNIGNNIPFTADGAQVYFSISYTNPNEEIKYKLKYLGHKRQSGLKWSEPNKKEGVAKIIPGLVLDYSSEKKDEIVFEIKKSTSKTNTKVGLLKIDLGELEIIPGRYEFEMTREVTQEKYKYSFDVIWMDKPYSLYKPDYAARLMYYILPDEEFDKLNEGDSYEIAEKIMTYWTAKDPTPDTPYNEALAEYFRRVDFAYFNLKDFGSKDGALTKRGMIYILNGEPDKVDDIITDKLTTVVWYYYDLKKEYVFQSSSGTDYKLMEVRDIK